MKPFKFVHTADLHLGSPFIGIGQKINEDISKTLRNATFDAFEKIVNITIEEKANFLLIAGDIYDSDKPNLKAQLFFHEQLLRLANADIDSFIVHGNHDPLDSKFINGLEQSDHIHEFGREVELQQSSDQNGDPIANIYGISHPTKGVRENLAKKFNRSDNPGECFAIGLLHCNLGTNTGHDNYAPCNIGDLKNANMDYWALGHIHKSEILNSQSPLVIYPGTPQALHSKEQGSHGCYVVNVDLEGRPSPSFVATDVVRWEKISVSIDQLGSEGEVISALETACEDLRANGDDRNVIGEITLEGRGYVHKFVADFNKRSELKDSLNETEGSKSPFVWITSIDIQTGLPWDIDTLRSREDFVGDLLSIVDSPNTLASLRSEIQPVLDKWGKYDIKQPTDDELKKWLTQARDLLLTYLEDNVEENTDAY